jgi:hypothetical protein
MKEIHSTKDIALLQNVSGSRIRQIWHYYRITKTLPILVKPGRPSRSITNEEMSAVIDVSGSRIRQIWHYYRITKTLPILVKPGRPSRSITNEEMSAVIGTYKEYPCSAVELENILDKRYGIKIPHNRIHKILKNHRLASNNTNKQK